ncbi:MAG: glucose-6-phosphate dehydrogenase [Planctomycetes bacterium]|nr:glucose-6-phosphate dehydrogenase [Planctomycetota bacterium]
MPEKELSDGTPDRCGLVIFGASGDLTRRKLLPALYNLFLDGLLPPAFGIVGFARSAFSREEFRVLARGAVDEFSRRRPADPQRWPEFEQMLHYQQGGYGDAESFRRLREVQTNLDRVHAGAGNWVYYLATPPSAYREIGQGLEQSGLACSRMDAKPWSRLVVEKPIGHDLSSARALNDALSAGCEESQTFRIDHYLGKETVQNILVLRFGNGIFEPLWNHHHIDHVQITVAETDGAGSRGGYYEEAGALRDMVQNHLFQLLCLVAMEPPHNLGADAIRDEKLQALESIRPIRPEELDRQVVRGQYAAGLVDGQPVKAYREEEKVARESVTETFVAMKVYLDNWRWSGVPFYLRTGKRLARRTAEIAIQFRKLPPILFNRNPARPLDPNVLSIRLQPNEGVSLQIGSKRPGPRAEVSTVKLDFGYHSVFPAGTPEAYERLLLDVMLGDATLFMRRDEVEAAWSFVTPILEGWTHSTPDDFPNYVAGSAGPARADELLVVDGRRWGRL